MTFYDPMPMPADESEACCHCGERIRTFEMALLLGSDDNGDEIGECEHGRCHAQCMIDAGCQIA